MFILIMKGNTQINRMEVFLLIILRFWAVRISFRYAIMYASSVAFVRRVDHSSFILSCNLIGQRENKSRYVTEIVLPLGYADVIFRRRESRQPEIRLRSQTKSGYVLSMFLKFWLISAWTFLLKSSCIVYANETVWSRAFDTAFEV